MIDTLRILDATPDLLAQLYDEILASAFSEDELDGPWWLDGLDEEVPALVAVDERRRVVGGVVGEWYGEGRVLLIAYLAVRADARDQGLGRKLMSEVERRWVPRFEPLLMLGEIEDPRHYAGDDAERRVRFYDRLGAQALVMPYFQPRLRPTANRVYHVLLCVLGSSPEARRDGGVDARVVRSFLEAYIEVCEGGDAARSPDAELRWLLESAAGKEIPLVPLAQYLEVPDTDPPG